MGARAAAPLAFALFVLLAFAGRAFLPESLRAFAPVLGGIAALAIVLLARTLRNRQ